MADVARKPVIDPPVPPPHRANSALDEQVRVIELNGHVGFDSMPHQLVKKAIEQGFQFNLMCVGETGIGKTTLIESLFNMKLEFDACDQELNTVELRSKTYEVVEGGIRLKMTIVETAGFGDQLDKDKSAQVIVGHINEQFEKYFKEELKVRRMLAYYEDTRIHACLYFISPTGHGLKALDLVTLRELSKRVNVIPVIAKSDTISKDDLSRYKTRILSELAQQKIEVYEFPTYDETVSAINAEMNKCVPFAIVGSTDFVQKGNGKPVRARRYPWGIVEVENEQHCDFVKLREALLRTNVDSLRERTHMVLYEQYRRERLRSMSVGDGDTGPKLAQACNQKIREMQADTARKEAELREDFNRRLTKKEEEMRREEEALNVRGNEIEADFERQIKALEIEMKQLQDEKARLESKTLKKYKK
ncbi:unnamed protein product, partial [Mesorhabditis belari]|uniref:Septin n=1 Tax=Mesorhabditis belari TaxID=2138241 RepID=A0AAF3FIH6_9BILA